MFDFPDVEWPDDLQCGECGALVGDDGVRIHVARFIGPEDPELYAWCEDHGPDSEDEERELWVRVKRGDEREQAQSWADY